MLPNIPKGFVTNFPHAVPDFIGPRQFIFLLASVAAFLLISTFFLTQQTIESGKKQTTLTTFVREFKNVTSSLEFPSSLWKKRFFENLDVAAKETDPQKQFEALSAIFPILMGIYNTSHDSKVRVQAENLAQFIQQEFADRAQNQNFKIPCLDLECGRPNYPQEITDMIERLKRIDSVDKQALEGILQELEEAAFSADPNSQWSSYFLAFQAIRNEEKANNNEELLEIAKVLRDFLKKNYLENYTQLENMIPGIFEI